MENMSIYNALREVPQNAQKAITGGRLKGMTDINPMWRIKALTELFGACGVGWRYTIDRQWIEPSGGGEIAAFCNISLYIKVNGEWSEAIQGTGGSAFVAKERNGAYMSDECFKMALTDAISVACKALGVGADVYWQQDKTKYDRKPAPAESKAPAPAQNAPPKCENCGGEIKGVTGKSGKVIPPAEVAALSKKKYGAALCGRCAEALRNGGAANV